MVTSVTSSNTNTTASATGTSTTANSTSSTTNNSAKAAAQALITSMGSGSGVDINSLANSLANAEIAPQQASIQDKIDKSNATISGYSAIKYVLGNLQTSFADLKDQSDFSSVTASSSQPTSFKVTTSAKADNGSHSIIINSIALSQRTVSAGLTASATELLNGGNAFTLSISVHGAAATTVNIPQGYTSPQDMVNAINAASTGVKASLVNTGSGTLPWRVMLTGPTGAENDFSVTSSLNPPAVPTAPTVMTTNGASPVTESAAVTFHDLDSGDTFTVGNLTYTASASKTAAEVAALFGSAANYTAGNGFSGTLSGWTASLPANGASSVTFISTTASANVTDLTASQMIGGVNASVSPVISQGLAAVNESAAVTFQALKAGESVTVAGLTFTAGKDLTATQVSSAFSNLANGASSKDSGPTGSYSGSLTGFSTGDLSGATLTATSSTSSTNVSNLVVSTSAADALYWGNLQTASDASLSADGMDLSSATNTIQDVIAGVTLELLTPTSGATGATLNLSRDNSIVKNKIQTLVTNYNDAITMLGVVSDPKSTVSTYGATLVGNSIVSSVRNQIRSMVIGDSNTPSGNMTALRNIGVSVDKNGQLQIDNTKLDNALKDNFEDVVKMLSNNQENQTKFNPTPAGIAGESYKKLGNLLDPIGGTLTTLSDNQSNKITDYQKQLDELQSRLQVLLKRYIDQFSAMDSLVGEIKSSQSSLKSTFDGMMAAYTKN